MFLLLVSFFAGMLTVLAPCVLPLLPVIIGGSMQDKKRNPYIITLSLAVTVVLFTLLLKATTLFIDIPQSVWTTISGLIIAMFGLTMLFPRAWQRLSTMIKFNSSSDKLLHKSAEGHTWKSDILMGMALGPVFSSCSPTYFVILATVLPQSFLRGFVYLIAYAVGLALVLLLISVLGQKLVVRLKFAANPDGLFKKIVAIIFLIVGVSILFGFEKKVETYLIERGFYIGGSLEERLLKQANMPDDMVKESMLESKRMQYPRYHEIVSPSGFVNIQDINISDLIGKKVILLDFMTYSCINCIRTFPYLNAWYDAYKDEGLEIIGIHTPEFAFEHKLENVEKALHEFGIKFPVVLDNDYATWRAYGNTYWPRKYLIDIDGNIVYDHIGEGKYDETEKKIQELLEEKMRRDNNSVVFDSVVSDDIGDYAIQSKSPETYFGSARNKTLGNAVSYRRGEQELVFAGVSTLNTLFLSGTWNFSDEFAVNITKNAKIRFHYAAQDVFFVARADKKIRVEIRLDDKTLTKDIAGSDVYFYGGKSFIDISEDKLYSLVHSSVGLQDHILDLIVEESGIEAYTFTFG